MRIYLAGNLAQMKYPERERAMIEKGWYNRLVSFWYTFPLYGKVRTENVLKVVSEFSKEEKNENQ